MEMTHQKHVLCLDSFSDREPSSVIARKLTGENCYW